MTERLQRQSKTNLVYTPNRHIPIGEAVMTENGVRAVRFKKAGEKDTEVVPIDTLIALLVNATNEGKKQDSQARQSAFV